MGPIPLIGTEFASYRIDALLGRGGFSVVYRAENPKLGNLVALKILAPELATEDSFRARFVHESRVAASINHPNIVPIYDFGAEDDLLYIAMRYVQGSDLKALIRGRGNLDAEHTVSVMAQAARALDAAHTLGLIHRDVKPANFLLEWGGSGQGGEHVYLSDFGLTKHSMSRSGLTGTGQFVGTIDYAAPEQIEGRVVDARSDIYSLGCVMYECLTGKAPFVKEAEIAVLWAHVHETPVPPSDAVPGLPPAIDGVVLKALAKSPDERYQSCAEMIADAAAALQVTAPIPAAPRWDDIVPATPGETVPAGARPAPPLRPPEVTPDGERSPKGTPPTYGRGEPSSGQTPPGEPVGKRRTRPWRPGRRAALLAVGAILAILAVTGGAVWWTTSGPGSSSPENPILATLANTNATTGPPFLNPIPSDDCHEVIPTEVACKQLPYGVSRATFRTYRSLSALYAAYTSKIAGLQEVDVPRTNFGDCAENSNNGEVSWNHGRVHPRNYSIEQLQDPNLDPESQAAGRVYCFIGKTDASYHVIWTQNSGHLLAIAAIASHTAGYEWWKAIHHNIGFEQMDTQHGTTGM